MEQVRPHPSSPTSSGFRASAAATGRFGVFLSYARSDGEAFDDGILWTTLGDRPAFKDAEDAATILAERLEGKNCLIVIDDVWDPAHLDPFLRGGTSCARLITSRLLQVATEVQAKRPSWSPWAAARLRPWQPSLTTSPRAASPAGIATPPATATPPWPRRCSSASND